MLTAQQKGTRTGSYHSLHRMQTLDFEALEKQPQTKLTLDILHLHSRNDTSLVKSCGLSAVWSSMSDIGKPSERVQREPKINSEEGETTPGVSRPLLVGAVTHRRAAAVTLKCMKP